FSNTPLSVLSWAGSILFMIGILMGLFQIIGRLLFPSHTPPGLTTTIVLILVFGSLNLFALSIIGEYLAKVFEEVKGRPLFIRRSIIRDGEVRPAAGMRAETPTHEGTQP